MHSPFHLTDATVRHLGDGDPVITDGFASDDEIDCWSDALTRSSEALRPAGTGASRAVDDRVRTDAIAWEADLPGAFPGLRDRFAAVREELNRAAWLGLDAFDIQLAVFAPGGRYAPHRDALRGDPSRRVTAILYLNRRWSPQDGGCLRVHGAVGLRDIEPRGGRLVVFLADRVLHEVLPGAAVRRAATAWYRGRGP